MGRKHREGAGGQEIKKYLRTFPDTKHTDLDSSLNSQIRAPAQGGEQRPRSSNTVITGKRQSGDVQPHTFRHTQPCGHGRLQYTWTTHTGRGPGSPPPASRASFVRPPLWIPRPQPATSQRPGSAQPQALPSGAPGQREGRLFSALPRQSRTPAEMPPMQAGMLPGAPLPIPEGAHQGEAAACLPSLLIPAHSSH